MVGEQAGQENQDADDGLVMREDEVIKDFQHQVVVPPMAEE